MEKTKRKQSNGKQMVCNTKREITDLIVHRDSVNGSGGIERDER